MNTPIIYLFRHGETKWNIEGRRQGQKDSPLTARGRLQAQDNARLLKQHSALDEPVIIYASPIGRARDTALIMLDELGISADAIDYDDRLMESSFGDWEGFTDAEVAERYPASWQARTKDRWNVRPPFGESYADVNVRVGEWLEEAEFGKTTLVICHGLTSRVLRGIYAGLTNREIFGLPEPHEGFFKLNNGAVSYIH